jgi:hypothetical protein
MRVHAARDAYLDENGFTVRGYDEPRTEASFFGFRFSVPNTPRHRWAIMLHDLHHVATGFGTDLTGEGEISAWELRRGLRGAGLYVGSIITGGVLMGLLVAPRRTLRAWRAAAGKASLFQATRPYEELLVLDVGALREFLRVPRAGLATEPRKLHSLAPERSTPALA